MGDEQNMQQSSSSFYGLSMAGLNTPQNMRIFEMDSMRREYGTSQARSQQETIDPTTGFTSLQLKAIEIIFKQELKALDEFFRQNPQAFLQLNPIGPPYRDHRNINLIPQPHLMDSYEEEEECDDPDIAENSSKLLSQEKKLISIVVEDYFRDGNIPAPSEIKLTDMHFLIESVSRKIVDARHVDHIPSLKLRISNQINRVLSNYFQGVQKIKRPRYNNTPSSDWTHMGSGYPLSNIPHQASIGGNYPFSTNPLSQTYSLGNSQDHLDAHRNSSQNDNIKYPSHLGLPSSHLHLDELPSQNLGLEFAPSHLSSSLAHLHSHHHPSHHIEPIHVSRGFSGSNSNLRFGERLNNQNNTSSSNNSQRFLDNGDLSRKKPSSHGNGNDNESSHPLFSEEGDSEGGDEGDEGDF